MLILPSNECFPDLKMVTDHADFLLKLSS